jgi:hypothetical protein
MVENGEFRDYIECGVRERKSRTITLDERPNPLCAAALYEHIVHGLDAN